MIAMTKQEKENLQCPFCPYTCPRWEWLSNHFLKVHKKIDVCMKLAELLSKQQDEDMVPVSKIEGRIKELESSDSYGEPECRCMCDDAFITVVKELKNLLPPQAKAKKEKEKPEE